MSTISLLIGFAAIWYLLPSTNLQSFLARISKPVLEDIEAWGVAKFERGEVADAISRWGTRFALQKRLDKQAIDCGPEGSVQEREYLHAWHEDLTTRSIAEQTQAANEQHYEVDTSFYNLVLGKHHKYSCALFPEDTDVSNAIDLLDEAEVRMLELYAERAQITAESRFRVLDLGCGWGSVTLWFAARFPNCEFVGLSNSQTQRKYILDQAAARGLSNVDVITGDINEFQMPDTVKPFDRVLSIEMFEHMKNYEALIKKVSSFMNEDALLFVHIFVHKRIPFHFLVDDTPTDWMARFFFSGGTMPADDTLTYFQEDLTLQRRWRVNGKQYALTLEAWLQRMDAQEDAVRGVLSRIYGEDNEELWWNRWRAFFFVCSELFNFNDGNEWFVSHYLFKK